MIEDSDARYLEAFANWLSSLAQDATRLADVVADEQVDVGVRRSLAAGLNYLFKSLDLIDDGIEGLGFLDDAFVLRMAAERAGDGLPEDLKPLAEDSALIREFLGDLAPRLDAFMESLQTLDVRQRSVTAIVEDSAVREELLGDIRAWASRYDAPTLGSDEKNLVKVRAFLDAKLPAA